MSVPERMTTRSQINPSTIKTAIGSTMRLQFLIISVPTDTVPPSNRLEQSLHRYILQMSMSLLERHILSPVVGSPENRFSEAPGLYISRGLAVCLERIGASADSGCSSFR